MTIIFAIVIGFVVGGVMSKAVQGPAALEMPARQKALRLAVRELIDYDVDTNYTGKKKIQNFIPVDMFPLSEEEQRFIVEEYRRERNDIDDIEQRKAEIDMFIYNFDKKRERNRRMLVPPQS